MLVNRIDAKFSKLKEKGEKALITFITAGDPDFDVTESLVYEMDNAGADIIELGIPFSDPVAEGPVIQAASERALKNGATLGKIFELVKKIRRNTQIPILFMMYINTVFKYGKDAFFSMCKECGTDGVIIPDMPFEERDELKGHAEKYGIHLISLVAPTSFDRIKKIAESAGGFLYCVSSQGVTGKRQGFSTDFEGFFNSIYKYTKAPTALGFGISNEGQIKNLKKYADGIIVGSAIVDLVAKHRKNSPKVVFDFVSSLKSALK